jgi:hypothetical protein
MKKGEATMKGWWMKASPGRSSTRWIKPPGQPRSRIKKGIEFNLKSLSEDFMKRKIPSATPGIVSYTAETSSHESMPELIRRRAYGIFEARGGQSGHGVEDWLQAEREINHHLGIQ